MKKAIALFAALLLFCLPAAAETLPELVDAAAALLFHTDNVTVDWSAEFRLDGVRFKTAEGHYVQDGQNSLWNLRLRTPRAWTDEDRESGYTIVANGKHIYVMEVYYPGTCKYANDDKVCEVLVRPTAQTAQLTRLARALAEQLPGIAEAEETETGKTVRIHLTEETTPPLLNAGLNLAAQLAGSRLLGAEFDRQHDFPGYPSVLADYMTVTQGILNTMTGFTVEQLNADVTLDAEGRITGVSGSAGLRLELLHDDSRRLEIDFSGTAGAYGASAVAEFDAAEYGVSEPKGYSPVYFDEEPELTPEEAAKYIDRAAEILRLAGCQQDLTGLGQASRGGNVISVSFLGGDGAIDLAVHFSPEGKLYYLQDLNDPSLAVSAGEGRAYDGDPEEARAIAARLQEFLDQVEPGWSETFGPLTPELVTETDGGRYIHFTDANFECMFNVRVSPDWRILFFSSVSYG